MYFLACLGGHFRFKPDLVHGCIFSKGAHPTPQTKAWPTGARWCKCMPLPHISTYHAGGHAQHQLMEAALFWCQWSISVHIWSSARGAAVQCRLDRTLHTRFQIQSPSDQFKCWRRRLKWRYAAEWQDGRMTVHRDLYNGSRPRKSISQTLYNKSRISWNFWICSLDWTSWQEWHWKPGHGHKGLCLLACSHLLI